MDVKFGDDAEEDAFFEEFSIMIAMEVYRELTGKEAPGLKRDTPEEPHGEEWEEDDLPARYPRLWERWSDD